MVTNNAQIIEHSSMSRFQYQAILICLVINMLDGFDVLAMAFTAASVAQEWQLDGKVVGLLLSSGLFGMAAGSLLLAPLADRWGRRPLIIVCLTIISVGMLLSALSQNATQLALLRALTGLGIGGILASLTVIVSEFTAKPKRSMAITWLQSGYPIGAVVGGIIASLLISQSGWRSVFVFGGLASLIMIPVVVWRLPESLEFLLSKRPSNALNKVNNILIAMGREPLVQLPPEPPHNQALNPRVSGLFQANLKHNTLIAWSAYFMVMFSFYFVLSWTPKLVVAAGLSAQSGISAGVLINLGGILGGLCLGWASSRLLISKLISGYMLVTAILMVAFGYLSSSLMVSILLGILIGFFLFGSMIGLYALVPSFYPVVIRTTGMGWAIGVGRFGAILSPLLAGVLLDGQWSVFWLYLLFSLPMVLSAIVLIRIKTIDLN